MDYQALHDEIVNDPDAVGYGPWTDDDDQRLTDILNDPAGPGAADIERTRVTNSEVRSCIDYSEWAGLDQAGRDFVLMHLSDEQPIDASDEVVRAGFLAVFVGGAGKPTRTALALKLNRIGSRAEVLWGEGATVRPADVGRAQNLVVGG